MVLWVSKWPPKPQGRKTCRTQISPQLKSDHDSSLKRFPIMTCTMRIWKYHHITAYYDSFISALLKPFLWYINTVVLLQSRTGNSSVPYSNNGKPVQSKLSQPSVWCIPSINSKFKTELSHPILSARATLLTFISIRALDLFTARKMNTIDYTIKISRQQQKSRHCFIWMSSLSDTWKSIYQMQLNCHRT